MILVRTDHPCLMVGCHTAEFALGCSPNEAFRVEVEDELVIEFRKQEERRSCLERPSMRVYDLILGSPFERARPADKLEEAAGWLMGEQATR
jgi:hypothetical protein